MKKMMRVLMTFMLLLTVTACGGGKSDSANEQEKIVKQYFEYLTDGEIDKVNDLMSEDADNVMNLTSFTENFESVLDKVGSGENFKKESTAFVKHVLKKLISEYKIEKSKTSGDKTIVTVSGKRSAYEGPGNALQTEMKTISEEYLKDHEDELRKVYENEGQEALQKALLEGVAKDLFDKLKKDVDAAETEKFALNFTVVKDGSKYLIEKIDDASNADDSDEALDKDEDKATSKDDEDASDTDLDVKSYSVDASKTKASATLLKKGRLADDEYGNTKLMETDLEFIDYNVTNGKGKEVDKYGSLDFSDGALNFELEIHGNKGSKVVVVYKDDRDVITTQEVTLKDTKEIVTKKLTNVDKKAKYATAYIYTASSYNQEYQYGDTVGSVLVSNYSE